MSNVVVRNLSMIVSRWFQGTVLASKNRAKLDKIPNLFKKYFAIIFNKFSNFIVFLEYCCIM